mgnify:CR=1 FL=1
MAQLINKVLNFVGWETEEEEEVLEEQEVQKEELQQPAFISSNYKKPQNKVVNIHSTSQFKVVIMQPDKFEDAQDICDHLKNKKPIVINLENVEKESAQRVIDFLSGAVYALDGNIQKVANGIFLIAPYNVDIMGDFKEELKNRGVFSWAK